MQRISAVDADGGMMRSSSRGRCCRGLLTVETSSGVLTSQCQRAQSQDGVDVRPRVAWRITYGRVGCGVGAWGRRHGARGERAVTRWWRAGTWLRVECGCDRTATRGRDTTLFRDSV